MNTYLLNIQTKHLGEHHKPLEYRAFSSIETVPVMAKIEAKPLMEFFTTIPGASHIFIFIVGLSIPSLVVYFISKKLFPVLVNSAGEFKTNLESINGELSTLSEGIKSTCESIQDYSTNLKLASDGATRAFSSINESLILTNQHITNLDTSIDVVKNAINSNSYALENIKDRVNDVKLEVKELGTK